ncbi:MAG: hypothetical protein LBS92_01950 [Candidatus Methanoplasma sp.]|jgi:hypothetical protein|nr:hypothetical protein [Candidatus Methanoplasma sp.]
MTTERASRRLFRMGMDAEMGGDLEEAYECYSEAYSEGDPSARLFSERVSDEFRNIEWRSVSESPLGRLRASRHCFESACCAEMRAAILGGRAEVTHDISGVGAAVFSDAIDGEAVSNGDECPYCGAQVAEAPK